jgi:hypothetical protein
MIKTLNKLGIEMIDLNIVTAASNKHRANIVENENFH